MSDSDATLPDDDSEFEVNESSTNPPNVSAKSKRTNPKTKPKNKTSSSKIRSKIAPKKKKKKKEKKNVILPKKRKKPSTTNVSAIVTTTTTTSASEPPQKKRKIDDKISCIDDSAENNRFLDHVNQILYHNPNGLKSLRESLVNLKTSLAENPSNAVVQQLITDITLAMNNYLRHDAILSSAFVSLKSYWQGILGFPADFELNWQNLCKFMKENHVAMVIQRRESLFLMTPTEIGTYSIINYALMMLLSFLTANGKILKKLIESIYILFNSKFISSMEKLRSDDIEFSINEFFKKKKRSTEISFKSWLDITSGFCVVTNTMDIHTLYELALDEVSLNMVSDNNNDNLEVQNLNDFVNSRATTIISTPLNVNDQDNVPFFGKIPNNLMDNTRDNGCIFTLRGNATFDNLINCYNAHLSSNLHPRYASIKVSKIYLYNPMENDSQSRCYLSDNSTPTKIFKAPNVGIYFYNGCIAICAEYQCELQDPHNRNQNNKNNKNNKNHKKNKKNKNNSNNNNNNNNKKKNSNESNNNGNEDNNADDTSPSAAQTAAPVSDLAEIESQAMPTLETENKNSNNNNTTANLKSKKKNKRNKTQNSDSNNEFGRGSLPPEIPMQLPQTTSFTLSPVNSECSWNGMLVAAIADVGDKERFNHIQQEFARIFKNNKIGKSIKMWTFGPISKNFNDNWVTSAIMKEVGEWDKRHKFHQVYGFNGCNDPQRYGYEFLKDVYVQCKANNPELSYIFKCMEYQVLMRGVCFALDVRIKILSEQHQQMDKVLENSASRKISKRKDKYSMIKGNVVKSRESKKYSRSKPTVSNKSKRKNVDLSKGAILDLTLSD